MDKGANRVFAFSSHGLFSDRALQRIRYSNLEEVIVTNTVPHDGTELRAQSGNKVKVGAVRGIGKAKWMGENMQEQRSLSPSRVDLQDVPISGSHARASHI